MNGTGESRRLASDALELVKMSGRDSAVAGHSSLSGECHAKKDHTLRCSCRSNAGRGAVRFRTTRCAGLLIVPIPLGLRREQAEPPVHYARQWDVGERRVPHRLRHDHADERHLRLRRYAKPVHVLPGLLLK